MAAEVLSVESLATQATKDELVQHKKVQAEIVNLIAETSKINSENKWYPVIASALATLVIITFVEAFL